MGINPTPGQPKSIYSQRNLEFLALALFRYRAKRDITQEQFAKLCDVRQHTISRLENGADVRWCSYEDIRAIINVVLAVSPPCAKRKVEPTLKLSEWWSPECAKPNVALGTRYGWPGRHEAFIHANVRYDRNNEDDTGAWP